MTQGQGTRSRLRWIGLLFAGAVPTLAGASAGFNESGGERQVLKLHPAVDKREITPRPASPRPRQKERQ